MASFGPDSAYLGMDGGGYLGPLSHVDDGPMWGNGKTADLAGGKKLTEKRCAWAVPGGIPSGWGQFGAVKNGRYS